MNTRPVGVSLILCVLVAACGRSPVTPSPKSLLAGTWRGRLTTHELDTGRPADAGPTTWTFTDLPNGGGLAYTVTLQSHHPWFAATAAGDAVVVAGGTFQADGLYASPRGCSSLFHARGTATATTISADFTGVDCVPPVAGRSVPFDGRLELTR